MINTTQIIVSVSAEGIVTAETKGVTGTKCLDYINVLENLLDADTISSAYTKDYDRQEVNEENGVQDELRQH